MPDIFIMTDDGVVSLSNVADIAEVSEDRLMVADLDGDQEMIDGSIFGARGTWKMWHCGPNGETKQYVSKDPMTMPTDFIRFQSEQHDRLQLTRAGRIKRLKQRGL